MNTNFEGILPVGFPVDAPWDERFTGEGSLITQVSVPGANRRWVRVNLPADTPVIEATTWDDDHTGMPCKYLAVPTYYKGLISWAATPFRPGVPNHIDTAIFTIEGETKRVAFCTYVSKAKISGLQAFSASGGTTEIWAVANSRITVSKLSTYDDTQQVLDLYVLPTLCNDGLIVKRRILTNFVVYQQVSKITNDDELPISLDFSPQSVLICKVADREVRQEDGLIKFGMLFSLNMPLSRMNTQTATLAPAIFSNAIQPLVSDTTGHYDSLNVVIEELPITIQAEAGATAPASAPGAGTDMEGVETKLGAIEQDLMLLVTTNAKLQAIADNQQSVGAADRATFSGHMTKLVSALSAPVRTSMASTRSSVATI